MPRAAKAVPGDQNQVILPGPLTKGRRIGLQGPGEEVEGPPPAGRRCIPWTAAHPGRGPGCAGTPPCPPSDRHTGPPPAGRGWGRRHSPGPVPPRRWPRIPGPPPPPGGDQHIADPLPRQGEGLAVRVAHQGVVIEIRHPGQGSGLVDDLPIGLVGDQPDGMAVGPGFLPQTSGPAAGWSLGNRPRQWDCWGC